MVLSIININKWWITKNIIFSGSATYTPFCEAKIMALYAKTIGVAEKNIFTESDAKHGTENIYYSFYKSRSLGFQKIALVTDPFQAKRFQRFTKKKVDPSIGMIPIVFDTLRTLNINMQQKIVNDSLAYDSMFIHIEQQESFWKRLKGTLGKNIDKEKWK